MTAPRSRRGDLGPRLEPDVTRAAVVGAGQHDPWIQLSLRFIQVKLGNRIRTIDLMQFA